MDSTGYLLKSKETINVSDVIKQLEMAQVVLDEKGLVDFTANLIFRKGKLHASNDRLLIVSPIAIKSEFSINGFDFYKALSGASGEAILTTSADKVQISSKKVKAELAKWSVLDSLTWLDQIDEAIVSKMELFKDLPKDFWEGLDWCKFSAGKDISVRSLTCVRLITNKVLSTDNYRVSRYVFDTELDLDVLIPKENVASLLKFPGLTKYLLLSNSEGIPVWLCFLNPETNFICGTRLVLGAFPENIEDFFNKEGKTLTLPEELKDQVNRAGKFAEGIADEATSIKVKISNKEITTTAQKASGVLNQFSELEYEGEDIVFYAIPALFEQILAKVKKITLCEGFLLFDVGKFSHALQTRTDSDDIEEEADVPD